MTLKARAAWLVNSLRNAHRARTDKNATHAARVAAAVIADDLINEAADDTALLRAALIAAVQPDGGQPPIPVVLGPQDRPAAPVSLVEIQGLLSVYAQACAEYGRTGVYEGQNAYGELWQAIQGMHLVAFAGDLHAQAEGRTP